MCGDYFSTIELELDLTEFGYNNYALIFEIVGAYLNLLRNEAIPEWVYTEIKTTDHLKYYYPNKKD